MLIGCSFIKPFGSGLTLIHLLFSALKSIFSLIHFHFFNHIFTAQHGLAIHIEQLNFHSHFIFIYLFTFFPFNLE